VTGPAKAAKRPRLGLRAFWAVVVLFAAADTVVSPLTDPRARRGAAYGSRYPPGEPAARAFGPARIARNFRLFSVFWQPPPGSRLPRRLPALLAADGNSAWTNLFGHFGLAVLLGLIALWLGVPIPVMLVAGTGINLWHEYVSEGMYCDPSWIDLWLDQIGLLVAAAVWSVGAGSGAPGAFLVLRTPQTPGRPRLAQARNRRRKKHRPSSESGCVSHRFTGMKRNQPFRYRGLWDASSNNC